MTHGERIAKKARGLQLFGCSDETCSLCNEVGQTWVSLIDSDPVLAALEKDKERPSNLIRQMRRELQALQAATGDHGIKLILHGFDEALKSIDAALAPTKTEGET